MADLISRQTAIDALNKRWGIGTCILGDDIADESAKVLNALPSAQPDIPGINVIIDTIKNAISASTGNDAYMVGLRNGMRWCLSALTDKEPEYEDMLPAQPVEDIHREREQAYYCGYEDGAKAARSAQPGWIPTSERLPDNDRAVLVTLKWAEDDYEVAVGEYWHNSTASHGWGSFEGHVIAWHELPTPYREGGQE